VATKLNNLAVLLVITNRLEEAEPLSARASTILLASLGEDHPSTQQIMDLRSSIHYLLGLTEAERQAKFARM
jgi:hypothetical protein